MVLVCLPLRYTRSAKSILVASLAIVIFTMNDPGVLVTTVLLEIDQYLAGCQSRAECTADESRLEAGCREGRHMLQAIKSLCLETLRRHGCFVGVTTFSIFVSL
jgi:hypothetical protein